MITTIHVSDIFRVAALRIAMHGKDLVDAVDDDGETVRGYVQSIAETNGFMWIVKIEHEVKS